MGQKNRKTENVVAIDSLIPDNANANRGTLFGQDLLKKSFRELGAGRSVLIDKNNRIIAGNKSKDAAQSEGIKDVIIVETKGDTLVAVRRIDLDINSAKGREMATADNVTGEKNLEWDESALQFISEKWDVQTRDWGVETKEMEEGFKPNLNPTQQNSITSAKDVERASAKIENSFEDRKKQQDLKDVTCPKCGFKFQVKKFDK